MTLTNNISLNDLHPVILDPEILEEDPEFSYDGFEVVRGEFFAHSREPSISFSKECVYLNGACLKLLPEINWIQILVNQDSKKLAVRPCIGEEKDSFLWCTGGKNRIPRHIKCKIFYAKIMTMMKWNFDYKYKLIGKLIHTKDEYLFIFDLNTPSIYLPKNADEERKGYQTQANFPDEWKNQFGIQFNEHRKRIEAAFFDGMTVFGMKTDKEEDTNE